MRIVFVATVHALAGRASEVATALERLRQHARELAGCVDFAAGRGIDDPSDFLVVSTWRDEPSLQAHFASAAYGSYVEAVSPALARPTDAVVHYIEHSVHPIGDPSTEAARQG
jgi:quinol monooxygenase YgiN